MNTPAKFALTLLLLATLIFVHELGHFLFAKLFRVKVLKFSLGFGPRLLGFTWGETEYRISAIPLGGYVKMAGEDPTEENQEGDRGRGFLEQAPWKRGVISLAGPAMNLLFPVLVYFVAFYFQTTAVSSRVGRVVPDGPAYAAGLREGDLITEINGTKVRYFNELQQLVGPLYDRQVSVAFVRGGRTQTIQVTPQRTEEQNLLETEVRGIIGVSPMASAPVVAVADAHSPAAKAGLQTFDRLVKVGDVKVETYARLKELLANQHGPVSLSMVRDVPVDHGAGALTTYQVQQVSLTPEMRDGQTYWGIEPTDLFVFSVEQNSPAWEAGIRRGDRLLEVNGTKLNGWSTFERIRRESKEKPLTVVFLHQGERTQRAITQKEIVQTDESDNEMRMLQFGAYHDYRLSSFVDAEKIEQHLSAKQALARSLRVVPDEIRKTGLVLARLVQGKLSFKNVGGPIMMYDIASRAAEAGWEYFLQVMALISINLGIMNLIPVPVLDGFHIFSAGMETISRRPLSIRARTIANYIGLALLFTLMAFVFKNDIERLLR